LSTNFLFCLYKPRLNLFSSKPLVSYLFLVTLPPQ